MVRWPLWYDSICIQNVVKFNRLSTTTAKHCAIITHFHIVGQF